MTPPLPLEEAQARLLSQVEPLDNEPIASADAAGRWLAEPVVARRTQPWAALSAMDGFATAGPGPWRIVGESAAGHPYTGSLAAGEATRISTGAALPEGADAVLIIEDSRLEGEILSASGDEPSPRHIRPAGFDFTAGDRLLDPGSFIGPAQLALVLAAGIDRLSVGTRPRLAILDTGDELATGAGDDRPDGLPASNGPMIAALCNGLASRVMRLGPVPDDRAALLSAFASASDADVLVTTGGASVGEHDLVRPALEEWGATVDFWRVAIRPGKPLLVARRGAQWVLGLPGNPASAYVTAFLFLIPLLKRLGGAAADSALPRPASALLEGEIGTVGARREFVRGVLSGDTVRPIDERDSSALRALAGANCLIDRPAGAPSAAGPARVAVYRLPGA